MNAKANDDPRERNDVLLPYQIRWMADESPIKVAEKSRRIGLTWTEAAASALAASASKGMDTWYLGYNRDMALEFVETAAAWSRQFNKAAKEIEEIAIDDERRDLLAYRIRFSSGHKIVALSSRPSNLRGKQGRAVIDEAAFHDDLKGLLKAALAFTMWGGCVRVMSTHNGANSAFNELVNEIRAGRKPYSLHRMTFDDALGDGLYHRICTKLGRKWSSAGEAQWRANLRRIRRRRRRRTVVRPAFERRRLPLVRPGRRAHARRRAGDSLGAAGTFREPAGKRTHPRGKGILRGTDRTASLRA
jgi:phage FluMu gp28-like protein